MNNLCGNQLNAPAKLAVLGDRIDAIDFVKSVSSLEVEQANEVHKDQHKNEATRSSFYKSPEWERNKLLPVHVQDPLFSKAD